jgi:hypothetical protein
MTTIRTITRNQTPVWKQNRKINREKGPFKNPTLF